MNTIPKTVLIADDDLDLSSILELRCKSLGLNVVRVSCATAALNAATGHQPDIVCMDVKLPGANGLAAAEMFRTHECLAAIPLIIITGNGDPDVERRCHQLPAYYVPKSANTWERLEPLLREHLGLPNQTKEEYTLPRSTHEELSMPASPDTANQVVSRIESAHTPESILDSVFAILDKECVIDDLIPEPQPWVLCIDDDYDFLTSLRLRLQIRGIGVLNAYDGIGGAKSAFARTANAIILDYNMPNGQGDYVLERLKESPATRDIPVIVLTGNKDDAVRRTMLTLGADAFLYKPPVFEQLLGELERHINIPAGNIDS